MQRRSLSTNVSIGLVLGAFGAAATAAWAGFRLNYRYWPDSRFDGPAELTARVQRSNDLIRWHQWAAWACLAVTIVVVALGVWQAIANERSIRRQMVIFGALALAAAGAAIALVTQGLVAWDQVGLWAVTGSQGLGSSGYQLATANDTVRLVIVGNAEVSPGRYGTVLLVHLTAPVVSAVTLAIAGALMLRRQPARPESADEPADAARKIPASR